MHYLITCILLFTTVTSAQIGHSYRSLKLRNLEEMSRLMDNYNDAENDSKEKLFQITKILMSRPDDDGALNTLSPKLNVLLRNSGSYEEILNKLVDESIAGISDTKLKPDHGATYVFILLNLLSEIKPTIKTNAFHLSLAEKIKGAQLKLSPKLASELRLHHLRTLKSPSEIAEELIKNN